MSVLRKYRHASLGTPDTLMAITLALGTPMPPIASAIRTIHLPKSFSYLLMSDYPVCVENPKPANAELLSLRTPTFADVGG
jgi:hypothetical protein